MIEENVYNKINKIISSMLEATGNVSEAFLQVLIAIRNNQKENSLFKKMPDGALKEIYKKVKQGDNLMVINVPDEDSAAFDKILKKNGVLYDMSDLSTSDTKIVLFTESQEEKIKESIKMLYAEKGLLSEMDLNSFLSFSKNDKLSFLTNIDDVEIEILRHYTRSNPIAYTITHDDNNNAIIVFRTEDIENVKNALDKISQDLTSEQGPLIREQIEFRLKGKQEVNIALEEAERESYIVDKQNPKNYIAITADDYTYYKNNKNIESIPRTDKNIPEAVYTRIEALTEPVVLTKDEFFLSDREKLEVLKQKTAVYPTGYSAMTEDLEAQKTGMHLREARAYAEKYGIFAIDEKDNSLDTIFAKIEQAQSISNRNQEDRTKDDIQYR